MAYSDELWAEAKKKCRLNQEDIALAKRQKKAAQKQRRKEKSGGTSDPA